MGKIRRAMVCVLSALLVLSAGGAALAASGSDGGVTVTDNFNIKEDREGAYAGYSVYEDHPEILAGLEFFSGGALDVSSGRLYEAKAEGDSVVLGSCYSGSFSMISQAIQEVFDTTGPGWNKDYRQFDIEIADNARPDNKLLFEFKEQEWRFAKLFVTYGGETVEAPLPGMSMTGSHYEAQTMPFVRPNYFEFLPAEGRFYCSAGPEAGGFVFADEFGDFVGFDGTFTVRLTFRQLIFKSFSGSYAGRHRTAKLMVYELNSQPLQGESPANLAGPSVGANLGGNGLVGHRYALPAATAEDVLDGAVSDCALEVTGPTGAPVALADGAFVPTAAGVYLARYTARDSGGLTGEFTAQFEIFASVPALEVEWEGELSDEAAMGGTFVIPAARGKNALFPGETADMYLSVQKAGRVYGVAENPAVASEFVFEEAGRYELIYCYRTDYGILCTLTRYVDCVEKPYFTKHELPARMNVGRPVVLPKVYAEYAGERKVAEYEVTFAGENVPVEEFTFLPERLGDYEITLSAAFGEKQLTERATVSALHTPSGLFESVNNCDDIVSNVDLPAYSVPGSGVRIIGSGNGATVAFANKIDLNVLTQNDNLVSFQALSGRYGSEFGSCTVSVTDAYDSKNSVKVKFRRNQYNADYCYVQLNYDGRWMYRSNEAGGAVVTNVDYGVVTTNSFRAGDKSNMPLFETQFDYAARSVYISLGNGARWLILDLDDPAQVGDGREWKGFATGEVYVELKFEDMSGKGGVIVTEVAGEPLAGEIIEDAQPPVISLEYDNLPAGEVGTLYPLPAATALDFVGGERETEISLRFVSGGNADVTGLLEEDGFRPDRAGVYEVEYLARDVAGNVGRLTRQVTVKQTVAEPSARWLTAPAAAVVGVEYSLPRIVTSGGSGEVSLSYACYLNGKPVELSANGKFTPADVGTVSVVCKVKDYLRREAEVTLTFEVTAGEGPVVRMAGGVPVSVRAGQTLLLPDFTAIDYLHAAGEAGYEAPRRITVNGTPVDLSERSYPVTEEKGAIITVVYGAGSGDRSVEQAYQVRVIDPKYVEEYFLYDYDDEDVQVIRERQYVEFAFGGNKSFALPNPVVADSMVLNFALSSDEEKSAPAYVDIVLSEFGGKEKIFFRFTANDDTTAFVQVNGKGRQISVPGSFSSSSVLFDFIFDGRTGALKNAAGVTLLTVRETLSGKEYAGFRQGVALVSAEVSSPSGKCGFRMYRVGNQTFASRRQSDKEQPFIDTVRPELRFETPMSDSVISHGENFVVSAAAAWDVLDAVSSVTVSVFAPDGTALLERVPCAESRTVAGTQYGYYRVVYYPEDSNNPAGDATAVSYSVHVRDDEAPVIDVTSAPPERAKAGEAVALPTFAVRDNVTADCKAFVFALTPDGRYIDVTAAGTYTPPVKGKYYLIIYAYDAEYNSVERVFALTVED